MFALDKVVRSATRATCSPPVTRLKTRSFAGMANQSIPVVLIGRTGEVGKAVTDAIKPEYEGKKPEKPSAFAIGTANYDRQSQAVIVGSYFTISMVDALRKQCGSTLNVPWMTGGMNEEQRDEMVKRPMDPARYGPFIGGKLKEAMARVKEEGKWQGDGVFMYK